MVMPRPIVQSRWVFFLCVIIALTKGVAMQLIVESEQDPLC